MIGYYINLINRKDRNKHFINNIKKYDFFKDLNRFDAINDDNNGSIGVVKSHINVLELCIQKDEDYFLIVEDDLKIIDEKNLNNFFNEFNKIKNNKNWDLITITPCGTTIYDEYINNFFRIKDTITTTGYIIKKDKIPILINNFNESLNLLMETKDIEKYILDKHWFQIQDKLKFFYFKDIFASQLVGYSDVKKCNIDYDKLYINKHNYKTNSLEKCLFDFINHPYFDMNNFNLAYEYEFINQTAAAVSYYLRCAEFTKNKDLSYESLLRISKCLSIQGGRDKYELACIHHAISINPNRPEAYYMISLYYSYRGKWLKSYMYACIGLENYKKEYTPLLKDIGLFNYYQLLFQKAYSGYNKGKIYESKKIYYELLYYYHDLDENYKKIIIQNLSMIPTKLQKICFKELDDKKNDICICSLSDREWLYSETIPTVKLYAEKYNCKFYLHKDIIDESRHPAWSKLLLVYNLLKLNRYEYVVWIDDDILLTDLNKDIREFIISDKNIILSSEYENSSSPINTGFVFYKNNIETLNILETVYKNGENNVHMVNSPWEQALMLDYYNNNKNVFEVLPYRKLQSHICKCEDKEKQRLHWKYGDFSAHFVGSDFDIQKDKKIRLKSISEIKNILKSNENVNNKNIDNKNILKNLENFPNIFCLSLSENKDKQEEIIKDCKKYNLKLEIFKYESNSECNSKINTNIDLSNIDNYNIGLTCGHIKMLKYWLDNYKDEYAFFCEDDIDLSISQYWDFTWNDFIKDLGNFWTIIQLSIISNNDIIFKLSPKKKLEMSTTGYLIKRDYVKYLISENYNFNLNNTEINLPEDVIYKYDESYLSSFFYPLSKPLFSKKEKYNSKIYKYGSADSIINHYKNNNKKNNIKLKLIN